MMQNFTQVHSILKDAVLHVLKYYAFFKYPLTPDEITSNCSTACTVQKVKEILKDLVFENAVFEHKGFFGLSDNIEELVAYRQNANLLAAQKIPFALRVGRLIAAFPFVRFVGISGSLSKGAASTVSDFDYFIVTSEDRLWICRTILHLFKKMTFIFGQEHKFCMNYFIDESYLLLEEQNLYTAIELASLIPVAGKDIYKDIIRKNKIWTKQYLPNKYVGFYKTEEIRGTANMPKSVIEAVINPIGKSLNAHLMNVTDRKWRKKWKRKNYPDHEYNLAFKTTLHHSKNHPANNQRKVLTSLSK